jgi:cell division protein FtsW
VDYKNLKLFNSVLKSDKKYNYDWILLGTVCVLIIGGLAFLASILSVSSTSEFQKDFTKQIVLGVVFGGIISSILAFVDYHWLLKKARLLVIVNIILLGFIALFSLSALVMRTPVTTLISPLSSLPIRPSAANGSLRWIDFGFKGGLSVSFQPSEAAKLVLLIYFAAFLHSFGVKKNVNFWDLKKPLYIFLAFAGLIFLQPDLGTVLIIFTILLSALWVSKISLKILAPLAIGVLIISGLLINFTDYRKARVDALRDGNSDAAYQITQVKRAIQNGGVWGKGYGNSEFKRAKLIPFASTDAIIGVIGEEMGFVWTTLFISLYFVVFWRGVKISKETDDLGGKSLAIGIVVWIVSQAFLNLAGITGLIPLKGLPLPFVSGGGTALALNIIAVGILLNISSQKLDKSSFSNP